MIAKEEQVQELMRGELKILREILGVLTEQQNYLLMGDVEGVQELTQQQDLLTVELLSWRKQRLELFGSILDRPLKKVGKLSIEIQSLTDQILTIIDKLKVQSERNQYLMSKRISLGKNLFNALQPRAPATYGGDGIVRNAPKTATLTLINKEG